MSFGEIDKEVMAILQEECAEVIQAVSKINRFGIDEVHKGVSNREHLEEEIGDLLCMIDLMREHGIISWEHVMDASEKKLKKLETWSNIK
jgi:NTP pyrophosphatase (non-canonical NTP hydrolase)